MSDKAGIVVVTNDRDRSCVPYALRNLRQLVHLNEEAAMVSISRSD
jgi:hypothetical protein